MEIRRPPFFRRAPGKTAVPREDRPRRIFRRFRADGKRRRFETDRIGKGGEANETCLRKEKNFDKKAKKYKNVAGKA